MVLPKTLTEAQQQNKLKGAMRGFGKNYSTARTIPYAERYRRFTGIYETPIERLQRAAKDEEKRSTKGRQ